MAFPERFLAYNNGISATARKLEMVDLGGVGSAIRAIGDLQIVNGGQTTASMHHAVRRDRADVSRVFVQAKITVDDVEAVEKLVPLISRYANSQNKVTQQLEVHPEGDIRCESLVRSFSAEHQNASKRD